MADRLTVYARATSTAAFVALATISSPSDATEPNGIVALVSVTQGANSVSTGFPPRPVSWWSSRVTFDGSDLWASEFMSISEFQDSIDQPVRSGKVSIIGNLWTIPSSDGAITLARLWGNAPVDCYLSIGTPRHMREFKLMSGLCLQKEADGDTAITGEFSVVDASVEWNEKHVCYALAANSGLTAGAIVRAMAESIGMTVAACPVGPVVQKPIQFANKNLLAIINQDLGIPYNWLASVNDDGALVVEEIAMKTVADWILDASNCDWDLDSSKETAPTTAPTAYYIKGSFPIGDNGSTTVDTSVVETPEDYNPKAYAGSGFGPDANGDYHQYAAAHPMVTSRVTTQNTVTLGRVVQSIVTTEAMYARQCGVSEGYVYGDGTHRLDQFEVLQIVSRITVSNDFYEKTSNIFLPNLPFGSLLSTDSSLEKIYAPRDPAGGHIFHDGSRHSANEALVLFSEAASSFTFNPGPFVGGANVFVASTVHGYFGVPTAAEVFKVTNYIESTFDGGSDGTVVQSSVVKWGFDPAGVVTVSAFRNPAPFGLVVLADIFDSYRALGDGTYQRLEVVSSDLVQTTNDEPLIGTTWTTVPTVPPFPYPGGTAFEIALQPVVAFGDIAATIGQFYPNTMVIDVSGSTGGSVGCENLEQLQRVLDREIARRCAIVRGRTKPCDPRWRRGDTVRLIDRKKGIDAMHMLVTTNRSTASGRPTDDIILEAWPVGS